MSVCLKSRHGLGKARFAELQVLDLKGLLCDIVIMDDLLLVYPCA